MLNLSESVILRTHEIAASSVKELVPELQNDKTPSSSDKYSYNLI